VPDLTERTAQRQLPRAAMSGGPFLDALNAAVYCLLPLYAGSAALRVGLSKASMSSCTQSLSQSALCLAAEAAGSSEPQGARHATPWSEGGPPARRYFTPKGDGAFTCLWFHVVPLDEHTTRVFNHAVIVQPMHPALKARTPAATSAREGFAAR